jgi:hypothetical protein
MATRPSARNHRHIRREPSTVHRPPSTIHHPPSTIHHSSAANTRRSHHTSKTCVAEVYLDLDMDGSDGSQRRWFRARVMPRWPWCRMRPYLWHSFAGWVIETVTGANCGTLELLVSRAQYLVVEKASRVGVLIVANVVAIGGSIKCGAGGSQPA